MGLRDYIKASREAMAAGMSGAGPSEEALASLTPEQRAAYDAQIAAAQQRMAEAQQASAATAPKQVLGGAAGEHVRGPAIEQLSPEQMAQMSPAEMLEWSKQQSKAQLKDVLTNPLGQRKPPPPPEDALTDPADRERQAAAERAARDEARAPYLAPDRAPLAFARLATRGKTQVEEVAAYLASSGLVARPDLVYGVYRVPDRISPGNMRSEKSSVVEWDVVHAATEALAPASAPADVASFDARETWVARAVGEPSVLDEDLGLAYLAYASIPPEQSLGIARHLTISNHSDGESSSWTISQVTSVHVFHAPGLGGGVYKQMDGGKPLQLPAETPEGFHVELLNWGAVAQAVHPQSHKRFVVPSPFPYLPSTPQELLRAYLEIVGVRPAHCYSAQVTEGPARDIQGKGKKGFMSYSTNVGEEQPCADGKDRRRLTGGSRIVVVYRDEPAYAQGRERWQRYQREVLQAELSNNVGFRRPVEQRDWVERLPGGLRGLTKTAGWMYDFVEGEGGDPWEKIPPHRYCWPPQKR
ncbi:MAG TPA: hypothetical protein VFZ89_04020 [Solirubrobacteraceae bacterium]